MSDGERGSSPWGMTVLCPASGCSRDPRPARPKRTNRVACELQPSRTIQEPGCALTEGVTGRGPASSACLRPRSPPADAMGPSRAIPTPRESGPATFSTCVSPVPHSRRCQTLFSPVFVDAFEGVFAAAEPELVRLKCHTGGRAGVSGWRPQKPHGRALRDRCCDGRQTHALTPALPLSRGEAWDEPLDVGGPASTPAEEQPCTPRPSWAPSARGSSLCSGELLEALQPLGSSSLYASGSLHLSTRPAAAQQDSAPECLAWPTGHRGLSSRVLRGTGSGHSGPGSSSRSPRDGAQRPLPEARVLP